MVGSVVLALQPLHTTSYIDKGEASIIGNREVVSWDDFEAIKALHVVVVSFELI